MKRLITIILTTLMLFNSSLPVNMTRADEFEEQNNVEEVLQEEEKEVDEEIPSDETESEVSEDPEPEDEIQEETKSEDIMEESLPEDEENLIEEETAQEEQEKDYVIPELTFVEDEFDNSGLLHEKAPDYRKSLKAEILPSSFILGSDALTAVRSQGSYGTCWSFSTIASLESTYKKDNGKSLDLSELHLAYFAFHSKGVSDPLGLIASDGGAIRSEIKNPETYLNIGGNYYISMYTLASGVGLVKESSLPYTDAANDIDSSVCYDSNYILDEVKLFNISERNVIKKAIYNDGAVGISMYYDDTYLYNNSYYYNAGTGSNHAVTLVGWDDNYSKDNFSDTNRPSGDGAWLVRNSWGTSFGDNGYFWMSYEDTSIADGTAAQFFIERNNFTYLYQYDGSAGTKYIYTYPSSSIYTGNIYKAQHDESLTEVGFYTYQTGMEYEITVYKKSGAMSNPTDGTLVSSATTAGVLSDAGFHTVELAQKVDLNKGEYFSVVVNYKKSGGQIQVRYDITENYVSDSYFTNSASTGESFVKESDTKSWKDCYNFRNGIERIRATARIKAYTIDEKVPIETGSLGTDTNFAVYRNGTMVISGSGSTDCQSYEEPIVETCESVNKVVIEEGVTDITDSIFSGFVNLEEIHIPETVEYIETGSFNDSNSITDVYYAGEKSEWESLDIADRNTVFVNTDIYFANGQYDKDSRLTVYQDDNDSLIIEGDKVKLDKIAEYTIYDNVLGTYTKGGAVCIYDSENNCQAYLRNCKEIYSEETKEYKTIEYNNDNTALAVSKDILLSLNLLSGDTKISLEFSDESNYEFEFNIRGAKKLESQPVITLFENGDLKIEADSDYLAALMRNCTETEIYESQHAQIEFIHSNGRNHAGDYYRDDAKIFKLSEDQTYIIYSNNNQNEIYKGGIINGENEVTLRAYGYEPSDPVTVSFTHNYISAPDDITTLYDSERYTLEVSSENTDWLNQITGICIAESQDLADYGRYTELSIEVIGNTCYISLAGNDITDGIYNVAVNCNSYCWYENDGLKGSSCNKEVIASLELNDVPGRRNITDYNACFNENGLVITSSDDEFLNQLTRNSDCTKTDEEIMEYADNNSFSLLRDSYIIVSDDENGNRIVLRNKENNRIIEKSEGKVTVSFASLQETGLKIFKNWTYHIKVGVIAYYSAQNYSNSKYGTNVSKIPSDLKLTEDSAGNLIIKTKDSRYLNNIRYLSMFDDEHYCNVYPEDITISDGKAVIDAEFIKLAKKSYNIQIQSYGYALYQKNNAITFKKHTLKSVPLFECEINEYGNMIISSEDTEWIDGLTDNSAYSYRMAYARPQKEQSRYVTTYNGKGLLYKGIEKLDDNSAVVYSSTLKSSGITSGTYRLQFRVSGYEISDETAVEFSDTTESIPSDLTKELKDGHLYIYTDDKAFIDSVAENDMHCHYVNLEYQNSYDITLENQEVYWPIEVGRLVEKYADVVKDEENGVLDFDLSDLDFEGNKRYTLTIGTDGTYPSIIVTVNSEVYSITYHDDHGCTEGRLDYLHFYTQGVDVYKYNLKSPVVPGYQFGGWYTDRNYKTKITSVELKNKTGDIDLYAKFTPITYTIKYNLNSGSFPKNYKSVTKYVFEKGDVIELPSEGMIRKGYEFKGWYTSVDFAEETKVTAINPNVDHQNFSLYAKWTPITYTVVFDSNNRNVTNKDAMAELTLSYDETVTLPANLYTRSGISFNKWTAEVNGKTVTFANKAKVKNLTTVNGSTVVLKATWTYPKTSIYSITYNLNGGKNSSSNPSSYNIDTEEFNLSSPTRTGYTFDGWFTDKAFEESSMVTSINPDTYAGKYVLYAKWTPVTYYIQYVGHNTNGDEIRSAAIPVKYDQTYKLSDTALDNPGMKAVKYTYTVNNKSTTVSSTSSIKNLLSIANEEDNPLLICVAKDSKKNTELWSAATYTITYNLNGGTNHKSNKKNYTITTSSFGLLDPTRKGAMFDGWYNNPEFNGEPVISIEKGTYGNKTLYAKWNLINYTISFNVDGGTLPQAYESGSIDYTVEDAFLLEDPARENYTFSGWYNGKTRVTSIKAGTTGDMTLTAKWIEGTSYTVAYAVNNPEGTTYSGKTNSTKVSAGKDITLAANGFKVKDKVFVEWNTEPDGKGTSYQAKEKVLKSNPLSAYGNETITLYAIWDDVKQFAIHYDVNCGDRPYTGTMNDQTMSNNAYKALTANRYSRIGYTFKCWNTKQDGTGTNYSNKAVFSGYKGDDGTITLYAVWTPVTYKITYNGIKSTDTNNNPVTYMVEDETITLSDPVRSGYAFGGWYSDSKFKNRVTEIDTSAAKAVTLYAKLVESDFLELMDPDAYILCQRGSFEETRNELKATNLGYFKFVTYKKVTSLKPNGSIISITVNGEKNTYEAGEYYPTALTEIVIEIAG